MRCAYVLLLVVLLSEVLPPPSDAQLVMVPLGLRGVFRSVRMMVMLGAVARRYRRNRRIFRLILAPMFLRRLDPQGSNQQQLQVRVSGEQPCIARMLCELDNSRDKYRRDSQEGLIIELMDSLTDNQSSGSTKRNSASCKVGSCPYSSQQIMDSYRRHQSSTTDGNGPTLTISLT